MLAPHPDFKKQGGRVIGHLFFLAFTKFLACFWRDNII